MSSIPVLYSFRRCPYAMRARMALIAAEVKLEHREILLKNKPPSMLKASPKATVPVLVLEDGTVLDQSWEIMRWAMIQNDPDNWLGENQIYLVRAQPLVDQCDGAFKRELDNYKYADRQPHPAEFYRDQGIPFLADLNQCLTVQRYLLADQITIADIAILPFIRQFANVDRTWFDQCGLDHLIAWLDQLLATIIFSQAMQKHPLWDFNQS
ncbi:MAG: glutathione S-transferase [bacterium]